LENEALGPRRCYNDTANYRQRSQKSVSCNACNSSRHW